MTTTGFAQRARTYLESKAPDSTRSGNEINEVNEVNTLPSVEVALPALGPRGDEAAVPDPLAGEFVSRWLLPEPAKTPIRGTDRTDRINSVSAPKAVVQRVAGPTARTCMICSAPETGGGPFCQRHAIDPSSVGAGVIETAQNIVCLTLAEIKQYEEELAHAPEDDSNLVSDRIALAISERMAHGVWPGYEPS